ncbi:MAG: threonylcarbamoyl-AMP synthase [bacterium TMED198]|nr:MAG: threonylcarbamoyl-AMP synthase [bacterium TMED198]|tara:strand:- start:456 stop:1031 length:576 start_codon:yes stop_codon:yes gene_type:complete
MTYKANFKNIKFALEALQQGKIIIYPTNTIYGFGVDATNKDAIIKLNNLKGRLNKPLSIIIHSVEVVDSYSIIDRQTKTKIIDKSTGKFTFLLKKKGSVLPNELTAKSSKIGIRIANHPFTKELTKQFNKPITTTSVNKQGEKSITKNDEIASSFPNILFFEDINMQSGIESTIIDLTDSKDKIVRIGAEE